ncbi:glycosyl transferase family 2 [Mobilisporobacter senegalensis]|uniref:Glycosyl transferase family 2 n=1 Tax=Mobilisporobacter senegalensis TaxID=1329262 RepID=A0A3N1XYV5_9FIRM|nr:glycosyltransferase [Mobilisporobacter senegalensis]ROR31468.1 glycosyl transferase family 2 [Mobilisporobacter senegalensis]
MNEDIVSVIIPSYNYEKYIVECMQSIVDQDYKEIELIVVEDYSKDNSRQIIKSFLNQDNIIKRFINIVYIENEENKGAHYSINKGVMEAKGKYIAIINADDLYERNRFSCMVPKMKTGNKQIMFSNVEIIDGNSKISSTEEAEKFRSLPMEVNKYPYVSYALLRQNIAISTGNMLFTKELYEKLKGFREYKYIHDWDFILRACIIDEPEYIANTKYYYRLHDTNSFRRLKDIADIEVKIVLEDFFALIKKGSNNPALNKEKVFKEIKEEYLKVHWNRTNFLLRKLIKHKYKYKILKHRKD